MEKARKLLRENATYIGLAILLILLVLFLLVYKLGSLVSGVSAQEYAVAHSQLGWQGLYNHIFYIPIQLLRSVDFFIFPSHGQTLTRLPNVFFGGMAVIGFSWIVYIWHGARTALLTSLLFITSSWVLHVSRYASFEVLYLWAVTLLVLCHVGLQRRPDNSFIFAGSLFSWCLLLYVPGMFWFVLVELLWQRRQLLDGWKALSAFSRIFVPLIPLIVLPLLVIAITRPHGVTTFLGLPATFDGLHQLVKNFGGIFVHVFVRGPQYPEYWLGRAPLLDIFTLTTFVFGLVFYATKWKAARSKFLGTLLLLSVVLLTIAGPVGFSILIPLIYFIVAAGVAYLLHDWLKTFPRNPVARGVGISLVSLAVVLACVYNLRSYFVAWPHNDITHSIFRYRL